MKTIRITAATVAAVLAAVPSTAGAKPKIKTTNCPGKILYPEKPSKSSISIEFISIQIRGQITCKQAKQRLYGEARAWVWMAEARENGASPVDIRNFWFQTFGGNRKWKCVYGTGLQYSTSCATRTFRISWRY